MQTYLIQTRVFDFLIKSHIIYLNVFCCSRYLYKRNLNNALSHINVDDYGKLVAAFDVELV